NFDSDLYGERIKVEFKHKIRSEKRFDSIEQLQAQIARDTEIAREWLAQIQPAAREQAGG
ncbi:MAG: riboflavin kinase, partial [Arenicellales bacterium]|nr:riboflavin kinase [Arenicellales bacterium]MEE1566835.1 riboflavin kinase [Arenicellales bacterium]